jgi:hypothetical protein
MAVDGATTKIGERGPGSLEFGTLAALSPSGGGEVVDGAREVSPRPSVVTGNGCGSGGGSPEEWQQRYVVNVALEAIILSTTCMCACAVSR